VPPITKNLERKIAKDAAREFARKQNNEKRRQERRYEGDTPNERRRNWGIVMRTPFAEPCPKSTTSRWNAEKSLSVIARDPVRFHSAWTKFRKYFRTFTMNGNPNLKGFNKKMTDPWKFKQYENMFKKDNKNGSKENW